MSSSFAASPPPGAAAPGDARACSPGWPAGSLCLLRVRGARARDSFPKLVAQHMLKYFCSSLGTDCSRMFSMGGVTDVARSLSGALASGE